jgi:Protein of unknown function (DUF3379)
VHCEEFRVAVGAEPTTMRTDIAAHAGLCAQCAAYQLRLQSLDRAIKAALHTRVDAFGRSIRPWSSARRTAWSVAAGMLLSVAFGVGIWLSGTRSSFADQLVAHAQGEPTALVHTLDVVPDAEVADLLQREGLRLRPGVLRVSYARGCEFHGYFAPHLVVQSDHGPVTVLVLPHERTRATLEHINTLGFDAVIVPAPRGVLVAVGRGATVGIVAQAALHALDYST